MGMDAQQFRKKAADRLRGAIWNDRGDDFERATRAFAGMSLEAFESEYGNSGRTCREILEDYTRDRAYWKAANDLLEEMLAKEKL